MAERFHTRPTTRRTSKSDRVDIVDGSGRLVAAYVQHADALRMLHDPVQIAEEAIGLFLELRERYGDDTDVTIGAVLSEISEGCAVDADELMREMAACIGPRPMATDDLEGLPF